MSRRQTQVISKIIQLRSDILNSRIGEVAPRALLKYLNLLAHLVLLEGDLLLRRGRSPQKAKNALFQLFENLI